MNISTREITSKKVREKNADFSTSKITPKKVCGNYMDFSTSKITSKKARGNDVDFSISEITSKKYVEMTWKFVEIWSLTYRRNINVKLTWIRRGVPAGWQLRKWQSVVLILFIIVLMLIILVILFNFVFIYVFTCKLQYFKSIFIYLRYQDLKLVNVLNTVSKQSANAKLKHLFQGLKVVFTKLKALLFSMKLMILLTMLMSTMIEGLTMNLEMMLMSIIAE